MPVSSSDRTASRWRPIDGLIDEILPSIRAFRHDLHQHPELGYRETRTAARIVEILSGLPGVTVRTGVAETGVLVTFGSDKEGPGVALRADMDALPIEEASDLPHRSQAPGVMHACGHDGHTAMLVGAGMILARLADELRGPVRLIFQPAEEFGGGGNRMVEDGALRDPDFAAVFGLHNLPSRQTRAGQFCLCPGAAMAGTTTFEITVRGRGGHAAAPHQTIDPVYVGSELVTTAQSLVSRRTDPIKSAVITFTQFHAGSSYNVIPETAVLRGTIRALDDGIMAETCARLKTQVRALAAGLGGSAVVDFTPGYPVTRNDRRTNAVFRQVIEAIGRKEDLVEVEPVMGAEDFSYYQRQVPGTFWFLASRPAAVPEVPFWHHPSFDFNDAVLADGMRMHVELARRFADCWSAQ